MNYKFAQLIQTPGKKGRTTTEVFIAQPDVHREYLAGKLFLMIEVESEPSLGQKISNFLIDSIVHNFYQNEKLLLREKVPSIRVESIFETALADTNKQLSELIKDERLPISFENISIAVGVVFENDLYITNSGKNRVFLIYPEKKEDNSNSFGLVDIFPHANGDDIRNYRLFSSVVAGKIPPKGSLFLTNEALPEYISQKQLISILSSLPPTSAIEQIRNILNSINTFISFAGLIVRSTKQERILEAETKEVKTSSDSISKLNQTEDMTDALLTPSGMISPKKWLKLLSAGNYASKLPEKLNPPLFLKDKIFMKRKSNLGELKNIAANFFANIFQALSNLFRSLKNKHIFQSLWALTPQRVKDISLPRFNIGPFLWKKKVLLALSLFFLLAAFISINKTKNTKELAADNQRYDEIIKLIEQKQNQADASLLYENNEGANKLFGEISALLEEMPKTSGEQSAKYEELRQKYDKQLEKIRVITRTDSASLVGDLVTLNSRADANDIFFDSDNAKIFASDQGQKSIYIVDLLENAPLTITDLENTIDTLSYPFRFDDETDKNIYYINNGKLIAFDTSDNRFEPQASELATPGAIHGADTYNNILYVVDTDKREIRKHQKTGDNFGAGSPWLSGEDELAKAVDMSIDGHIYVLLADGQIQKFLRGSKTDFKLESCDPPLTAPSRLQVSKDKDFIYVLEPDNKRLIVFDKEGGYHMQYMGDNLSKLKDFVVDEEKKIVYFLAENKVLKLNAVHLEPK